MKYFVRMVLMLLLPLLFVGVVQGQEVTDEVTPPPTEYPTQMETPTLAYTVGPPPVQPIEGGRGSGGIMVPPRGVIAQESTAMVEPTPDPVPSVDHSIVPDDTGVIVPIVVEATTTAPAFRRRTVGSEVIPPDDGGGLTELEQQILNNLGQMIDQFAAQQDRWYVALLPYILLIALAVFFSRVLYKSVPESAQMKFIDAYNDIDNRREARIAQQLELALKTPTLLDDVGIRVLDWIGDAARDVIVPKKETGQPPGVGDVE